MSEGSRFEPMGPRLEPHRIPSLSPPQNPPPPLLAIDQPNPPNVVISKNHSDFSHMHQNHSTNCNAASTTEFMQNTRQIITASRLDPDLLATCANKDIDDVDLDRMYMEAMMEDFYSSVGR